MPSSFQSSQRAIQKRSKNRWRRRTNRALKSSLLNPLPDDEEAQIQEEEEMDLGFDLRASSSSKACLIQPLGNLLLNPSPTANIRDAGLGSLRVLSDELVVDLLGLLDAKDLGALATVSKCLYVFSTHEPLWRNLVLRESQGDFIFNGSWRSTYLSNSKRPPFCSLPSPGLISIKDFYSDFLFQSWLCANLVVKTQWLQTDNIERRRGISVQEFVARFEEPNKPVLLEGCLEGWPALTKWSPEWLVEACADARFSVGPVEMTMARFVRYAEAAREERPLYLFDPRFADKVPELGSDYEVPIYFRDDLFGLLGKDRPDYRWIIIGPAGSGSSFHVDPNSTSAWNAVIRGSKKWILFPPEVVPPGVHPSPDGAEVACPVSIMEWFMNFYPACSKWQKRPVECVCGAGEVVFVPNGWWHLVLNLEDSVAITHNYVSRHNLLNVLNFLNKPNATDLVSGTKDGASLHDKFKTAVEAAFPGAIDDLTQKAQEKMAKGSRVTFWESITDANVGSFKFSLTHL